MIGQHFFFGNRDTVRHHDTVDRRGPQSFDRRTGENSVRGGHMNFRGALFFDQFGCSTNRTGRADHVVEHQADFAFDRSADDVFLADCFGAGPAFVDDGDLATQPFGMTDRPFDAAFVRADDAQIRSTRIPANENSYSTRWRHTGGRPEHQKTPGSGLREDPWSRPGRHPPG